MSEQKQSPAIELGFDEQVQANAAKLEADEKQAVLAIQRLKKIPQARSWLAKVDAQRSWGEVPNPWSTAHADPLVRRYVEHSDRQLAAYLAGLVGQGIAAPDYAAIEAAEREKQRQAHAYARIEEGERMTARANLNRGDALTQREMRLLGMIR